MRHAPQLPFARAICILSCLVSMELSAIAQAPKRKDPGGMLGFAMKPDIQKEIGIDNDGATRAKLQEWGEAALKKQQELRAATKGDQDQFMMEADRNIDLEYRADLKKLLTAAQYKRVQEIKLRTMDFRDLTDPDVVEVLELTPDQTKDISNAQRDDITRQKEYTAKTKDRIPRLTLAEQKRDFLERYAIFSQRIEEILSKDQLAKFRQMQGMPLK